jgi:type II secretory pathway pseudopilin PulG
MLVPKTDGNKLTLQLQQELAVAPFLVGMALPAVQQVRAAARRTQSMNNARQAALAFLNYESAHGKMPTQANYDKNGRPLLSWRVHMLPFMEEQALYEQFHLDEPWDSPHNKKLIRKMPEVYSSPSVAVAPGKTVYLGIAGENTAFGKDPLTFSDIKDGTSNTAMIVEANPSHAVEWTRPKDWEPDERDPMSGLGRVNPGGFIVTLMDGSTQFMSNQTDPEQWKSMWTIAGDDGR